MGLISFRKKKKKEAKEPKKLEVEKEVKYIPPFDLLSIEVEEPKQTKNTNNKKRVKNEQ